jgi:hypothetical protein
LFEDTLDYDLECGSEIDSFTVDIPRICLSDDTPEISDEPIYDEYPEEREEKNYFSSHLKIYSNPPLFDECGESVYEDDEQKKTLVQHERNVDTERGVNQYQVQFKNLFQLILKPFNYIQ